MITVCCLHKLVDHRLSIWLCLTKSELSLKFQKFMKGKSWNFLKSGAIPQKVYRWKHILKNLLLYINNIKWLDVRKLKNVSRVRRESNVGRIHSGLMPHFSPSVIQEFCILIPSSYKNQGMCSFIQKAFQLSSQKYTWHFIRFTYNKQKRVFSCFKYNSIFSIKYWFCISLRIRQSVRMKWKYIIKSSFFQLFCLFHFTRKKNWSRCWLFDFFSVFAFIVNRLYNEF